MNNDKHVALERLARDAGLMIRTASGHTVFCPDELARFAALVRAQALGDAARTCERRYMGDLNREDQEARRCAEAIRALDAAAIAAHPPASPEVAK